MTTARNKTINTDTLSRPGAEALAAKLDAYWRAEGYPLVRHWVEKVVARRPRKADDGDDGIGIWVVRSNLVNGLPSRGSTTAEPTVSTECSNPSDGGMISKC